MRLVTIAGPPSVGKTAVIGKTVLGLGERGVRSGVIKFDCLFTDDEATYQRLGIPVRKGLSGSLCPDHFFASNIEEAAAWGLESGLEILFSESAGLCNRCSPHLKDIFAVCVVDNLSGVNTPAKIGPMLKTADMVVVTKGDIVSQAEREVFAARIMAVNPRAQVLQINGLTGQGAYELGSVILDRAGGVLFDEQPGLPGEGGEAEPGASRADETAGTMEGSRGCPGVVGVTGNRLRFPMPSALCSYCLGETRIGQRYQLGNVRKMNLEEQP